MDEERQHHQRAIYVLRENIRKLLDARHEDQQSLARWCGHDKSWINKFLNNGRGVTLKDFDRIASFFGIEPYQLFQPGISALTERRHGFDRRSGGDRRVGHQGRELAALRTEIEKHPALSARGSHSATRQPAPPDPMQRAIERFAREIHSYVAREQAAAPSVDRAGLPRDRRKTRRSTAKPA